MQRQFQPIQKPVFTEPTIDTILSTRDSAQILQPTNISLLRILISAQAIQEDFHQYDIVSGRNPL